VTPSTQVSEAHVYPSTQESETVNVQSLATIGGELHENEAEVSMKRRYRVTFEDGTAFETSQMRTITHAWLNRYDGAVRYGFSTSRERAEASARRNAEECCAKLGPVSASEVTDCVEVMQGSAD
jgi:hypothetical protein